jgi:hypothetical protein
MQRRKEARWRAKVAITENLSDNSVGSRAKGLELDLRLREFEISQLTQRNNFFMIFQGVLIAGLVQSQGTAAALITFAMAMLGVGTSVMQIGMAGGAKYWQSRWEASTRSSEIAIVLELLKQKKLAVQTFTLDPTLLTMDEQKQIKAWNDQHLDPNDHLIGDPSFINNIVKADINGGRASGPRNWADWWVKRIAIEPKWSVSRIPIWVGAMLMVFWVIIAINSINVPGFPVDSYMPSFFKLVPLKQ